MKQKEKKRKNIKLENMSGIYFLMLSVFFILYYQLMRSLPYNETGTIKGINYNILVYFSSVFIAFGVYIVTLLFLRKFNFLLVSDKLLNVVWGLLIVLSILFLLLIYESEMSLYASQELPIFFFREQMPHKYFLAIMLPIVVMIYFIIRSSCQISKCYRIMVGGVASFLCALFTYAPNPLENVYWRQWHIHAYENSIINIAHYIPYDEINCSIYGHYGLIYLPFVKIFGDDINAIAITVALFTFVTVVSSLYVLNTLVKHDMFYTIAVMALVALNFTVYGKGHYLQTLPHRFLFPMLVLAYITYMLKVKKTNQLFEWLVGILAIVFNLETGLCCVVVISIFQVFLGEGSVTDSLRRIGKQILYALLCVCGAYLIVNIYNVIFGGSFNSIKTFIYPISSQDYNMNEILRLPIPTVKAGYMLHLIIFSYALFESIRKLWYCKTGNRKDELIKLVIAASGLGALTYCMNRPAAGCISISRYYFVFLLSIYADYNFGVSEKDKRCIDDCNMRYKWGMSYVACFLVIWFAVEGLLGIGTTFENRVVSVWNTESLKNGVEELKEIVPEDTLAFGLCIPELYYELGWDTQVYITDWADMNIHSLQEVQRKIDSSNSFVMRDGIDVDTEGFRVESQINIMDGFSCSYYVREE